MIRGIIDINTDPGFVKASHSGMVLSYSSGLDDTMVPGGSTGQADLHGPGGSVTLKYYHGLRCRPRLWNSAWSSVVRGVITDPIHNRIMDPNLALDCIPGLDVTMVMGGMVGLPGGHGPSGGYILLTPTCSQVLTQTLGIHKVLEVNRSHRHQQRSPMLW